MRAARRDWHRIRHSADPFSQNGLFLAVFSQWVCSLASTPPHITASPPANGGNCTIRAATRRRHAEARLLMLQNPHPPAVIPPPRSAESPPRRGGRIRVGRRTRIGGRIRVGGRTGIVGVSIRFRTPNHPGRSAPGRCSAPGRRPLARRAAHEPPRITPTRMPPRCLERQ